MSEWPTEEFIAVTDRLLTAMSAAYDENRICASAWLAFQVRYQFAVNAAYATEDLSTFHHVMSDDGCFACWALRAPQHGDPFPEIRVRVPAAALH